MILDYNFLYASRFWSVGPVAPADYIANRGFCNTASSWINYFQLTRMGRPGSSAYSAQSKCIYVGRPTISEWIDD